jgi:ankyrin repeat protein
VEALLDQGAPVDAPDAAGNTALMESVRADHPGAAAALRRHGASLDRKNRAGESARDMATTQGDARLNQAVGLGP